MKWRVGRQLDQGAFAMFPDLLRDDVFRLETGRLWLRWPRASDAAEIAGLAGENDVACGNGRVPQSVSDAVAFILRARRQNSEGKSAIFVMTAKRRPGVPLGTIALEDVEGGRLALSFWLARPYCKRSLITEAVRAIVDLAFTWTIASDIVATLRTENSALQRAVETCGFQVTTKVLEEVPVPVARNRFVLRRMEWLRHVAASRGPIHVAVGPNSP